MRRLALIGFAAICFVQFSRVESRTGFGLGEQEWGYVLVRPYAYMFWWLYFTTNKETSSAYNRPLVIWLQGGPGGSSCGFGNFVEIGPYDLNLRPRNHTWVNSYNVLFIDNPVGAGFSYAYNKSSFATTNGRIAKDLLDVMKAFYKRLPEFRKVPVYITSESYGGKMAAEFALLWYKAEQSGDIESNLRGVGLGDSWISPVDSVLTWAPYLLQMGMVDTEEFKQIDAAAQLTRMAIATGQWKMATELWQNTENVILKATNNINFYNILTKVKGVKTHYVDSSIGLFQTTLKKRLIIGNEKLHNLMNTKVRTALNLTTSWGTQSDDVFAMLSTDFMKPNTDIVESLLNNTNIKVFVYTGQLDLIVDTPGTLQWVERLNWEGSDKWKASERTPVIVNGIIEGYRKSYDNLIFYWINRSGHMVPADNPVATAAMLKDLTQN